MLFAIITLVKIVWNNLMSTKTCQYCGGQLASPTHNNCQWCNVMIADANCNGVYDRVMQVAESMRTRNDLKFEDRRAEIQSAYDTAMQK